MTNCPALPRSGVTERFPNWTQSGVSNCCSILRQDPVQVAEPLTEFWAKGTGASKIENRSPTPFPNPVSRFFFTRSRGERGERGGRRIGFSLRTPRLRVRPHPPFPLHVKKQFFISASLSGRSPQAPTQRQTPSSAHKAMSGIRKKTRRRRGPASIKPTEKRGVLVGCF
jgi:hypothetical protein